MPIPILAIAALASAAVKGISAANQKKKARELLNAAGPYPVEQMPAEILENQTRARVNANNGLPSEQYNLAMKNIQRQQMNAIKNASDRRAGLAILPAVQQGTNDATLQLDAANAKARMSNERYLDTVNRDVAGWKSKLFRQNVLDKYVSDTNYARSVEGAGNQNAVGAVDSGLSGIAMLGNDYANNADKRQAVKFHNYGSQGDSAYNWAQNHNMNFNQYRRFGTKAARAAQTIGY